VCPGSDNAVLVTTRTRLYGSPDGDTFVPLFATRDSSSINDVACSLVNPREFVVATSDGTYRSVDGGNSFDPLPGDVGSAGSSAVAFIPATKPGETKVVVATGRDVWIGDPGAPEGLHVVPVTAGADADIRNMAVTTRSIWLATDNGVRVTHDGGATWAMIDDLEGFTWEMIAVAERAGQEHVEVLREDSVWGSSDGVVFRPTFRGQSRHRLRQLVTTPSGGFLVLTSGEIWTTTPQPLTGAGADASREWARQRIQRMASLENTIHRALVHARLTVVQLDELYGRIKKRGWFPGVYLTASRGFTNIVTTNNASVTDPSSRLTVEQQSTYSLLADFVWELPDLVSPSYTFTPTRKDLYELRKRMSFVVEDAYEELRRALTQLAAGGLDVEQVLTLEARVDALDVVLTELTGANRR
jgi:hypothetical protein